MTLRRINLTLTHFLFQSLQIAQELGLLSPSRFASLTLISTHAGRTIPPLSSFIKIPGRMLMSDEEKQTRDFLRDLIPHQRLSSTAPKNWTPQVLKQIGGGGKVLTMLDKFCDEIMVIKMKTRKQSISAFLAQIAGENCQMSVITSFKLYSNIYPFLF